MRDNEFVKTWLDKKVPIEVLENRPKPKSKKMLEVWIGKVSKIKTALAQGGELWSFSSPPKTWANMGGRAGYAVVRNGEVVEAIVTLRN